jgi:endonuclease YncB( thermonuclease family)
MLLFAAIGPPKAQAAQPSLSATTSKPEAGGGTLPLDSEERKPWGTVRTVLSGTRLVVVTADLERFDVRLVGVELPEMARTVRPGGQASPGQPFGEEAAGYVRDLLVDKQVRLDTYGKDRLGRTLAVVWLGDINVNLTLVKEGFAWVDPSVTIPKVRAGLEVAERQAQVGKYGLWALPNPEPPWEYRKRHRLSAE